MLKIKQHNNSIAPRATGHSIEKLASQHLESKGLKLIESNFSCKLGEIDLIMQDNDYLVFTEVRYRKNNSHGSGFETIGPHKQRKIIKTAMLYLQKNQLTDKIACRFDVVSVADTPQGKQFEWIKDAFQT